MTQAISKPIYQVPSMKEIEAIKPNGFNVVSTFSGAGGSCLGYRMAGFKVLWANEFIPAARDTYKANHPASILDGRDIREVKGSEILEAVELKQGEIDIFDGSPPCASFSTAGKREKSWGKSKKYSDTVQRVDDLFFEYSRLVNELQPKVFVAENVSGLVKGTAKGYFIEILKALKACGYNVKAKLLDAQWLGVPQMRQRIIFIGVRNDLGLEPAHPMPLPYRYSVKDALPWIVKVGDNGGFGAGAMRSASASASATIGSSPQTGNGRFAPSKVEVEIRQGNKNGQKGENDLTNTVFPTVMTPGGGNNTRFFTEPQIVGIEGANGYNGHAFYSTDQPMATIQASRPLNVIERAAVNEASFSITAEGGNTSKASVTHPTEKRKFTIAELKRICAFPDDFILTGSYAQQWERLGRSVPPVMMSHIAQTIEREVLCKI